MMHKHYIFIFVLAVIFGIAGLSYWPPSFFDNQVAHVIDTPKQPLSDKVAAISSSTTSGVNIPLKELPTEFSTNDRGDIEAWHKGDVIMPDKDNHDYASYDEKLLKQLADSGDVRAMKFLYLRYLDESSKSRDADRIIALSEKKRDLITQSIVYGDRELLGFMPEKNAAESRSISPNSTPEQKHQATIEALAYSEFMGLRGALGNKYDEQKTYFTVYSQLGATTKLTDADKTAIRLKAKEIYDSYEQKRRSLGLGPFDNSIPEGVAKAFEKQKKLYIESMGANAI